MNIFDALKCKARSQDSGRADVTELRRHDKDGRDVHDAPEAWRDDDVTCRPGSWIVWTDKQQRSVCNPEFLADMIAGHGMMNVCRMVRCGAAITPSAMTPNDGTQRWRAADSRIETETQSHRSLE